MITTFLSLGKWLYSFWSDRSLTFHLTLKNKANGVLKRIDSHNDSCCFSVFICSCFTDIADTLCFLLVGSSEEGASQGIEVRISVCTLCNINLYSVKVS